MQRPELHARRSLGQTRRVIAHRRHRGIDRVDLAKPLRVHVPDLIANQNAGYVRRKAKRITGHETLADADARHLYMLMAYKDRRRLLQHRQRPSGASKRSWDPRRRPEITAMITIKEEPCRLKSTHSS